MTTVHTLASGSFGNAALLSCDGASFLIDAGISCRRITAALKALELSSAELDAIFITHTHSDQIFASARACRELRYRLTDIDARLMAIDCPTRLLGVSVTPIPTSHDSPGSCGWRFDTEDGSVGFLTDTGYVTDEALDLLPGVDLAIIEANHDVEALCSGPYPYSLKQRILGPEGHLSNEDAARLAVTLAEAGASELVLAHLSRDNNTPAMALNAVTAALEAAGLALPVSVAPRECTGPCHTAHRRAVCKR